MLKLLWNGKIGFFELKKSKLKHIKVKKASNIFSFQEIYFITRKLYRSNNRVFNLISTIFWLNTSRQKIWIIFKSVYMMIKRGSFITKCAVRNLCFLKQKFRDMVCVSTIIYMCASITQELKWISEWMMRESFFRACFWKSLIRKSF